MAYAPPTAAHNVGSFAGVPAPAHLARPVSPSSSLQPPTVSGWGTAPTAIVTSRPIAAHPSSPMRIVTPPTGANITNTPQPIGIEAGPDSWNAPGVAPPSRWNWDPRAVLAKIRGR